MSYVFFFELLRKMKRIFIGLPLGMLMLSCSSSRYFINEWAIRDVQSLDNYDEKTQKIITELKKEGFIRFTADNRYVFYTPYGSSEGRWFMKPRDKTHVYTIGENNDTVKNKIVKYSAQHIILETTQPGSRMLIDLIPKTDK